MPAVALATGTVIVQLPLAGMFAPLKVTLLPLAFNAKAAPVQVLAAAALLAAVAE